MRPFFLFRLRARADLSLAFWLGGMKNACFFASLMISSVITLRLKSPQRAFDRFTLINSNYSHSLLVFP